MLPSMDEDAFLENPKIETVNVHIPSDAEVWYKNSSTGRKNYPSGLKGYNLYMEGKPVIDLVIPESLTKLEDYVFSHCNSIRSVTIPNSVTRIGIGAFRDCQYLRTINIPHSVKSTDGYAFKGCLSLASVSIPYFVNKIGTYASEGCISLKTVSMPSTINYDKDVFLNCCNRGGSHHQSSCF